MTVSITGSADFRGLLCQVRQVGDSSILTGMFDVPNESDKVQELTCDSPFDSVTHTNNFDTDIVEFKWWPPMGDLGDVEVVYV